MGKGDSIIRPFNRDEYEFILMQNGQIFVQILVKPKVDCGQT